MKCSNAISGVPLRLRFLLVLLILCGLVLAHCDKSPVQPPNAHPNYFPERVGSVWLYVRYVPPVPDESPYLDTVRDSIARFVSDSLGKVYVEIKETSYFFHSSVNYYERVDHDTISIYSGAVPADTTLHSQKRFVLPFDSGRWWENDWPPSGIGYVDTFRVVGFESVTVPAGAFQSSVLIHRRKWFLNDYFKGDYWFVDGIGIVKKYEMGFAPWMYELISYRVPRYAMEPRRGGK